MAPMKCYTSVNLCLSINNEILLSYIHIPDQIFDGIKFMELMKFTALKKSS